MKICLSCEGVSNTQANRCGHCGAWLLPTDAVHYPVRRGEIDAGNPLLGTIVDGKYRLQGVLGRGGLGTVFRAQHIGSLLTVALKLLHPRFSERPEYRRALLPEARRAATVAHERCARLLDVGEAEDGVAYLAMELVDGKTLDGLVRSGALPPGHAVDILTQIAEALAAIHAVGLVHCDLSPRNVMVSARGGELHVKVLDFGIARSVSLAGAGRARGEFAGFVNPAFSAPEVLAGGDVDPRADLYSFGSLAWLLLTGSMPVDDSDPRRAAGAVAAGELRPWPATPGVGRRLARLVQRCVRLSREERPASVQVVQRELAIVRGARRPLLVRGGALLLGLGVLANLAGGRPPTPPFLQLLSGTRLSLSNAPLEPGQPAQDLTSDRLATLSFDFGGFAPSRLRAHLVHDGTVLLRKDQQPEVDQVAGTLSLSTAQPAWRALLEGLVRSSREGPVDLVFVVPGAATLGSARVRIDDEAPTLEAGLLAAEPGLAGRTRLRYHATDAVGIAALVARVDWRDGRSLELALPIDGREFALGEGLAAATKSVAGLGAGEVVCIATDRAGNSTATPAMPFPSADVAAPGVVEVTGPRGEAFVPTVGGRALLRLRLSAAEAGCVVAVACGGEPGAAVPLTGAQDVHALELAVGAHVASAPWQFVVTDAVGNQTRSELPVVVRDRSMQVEFTAAEGGLRWLGGELVFADRAAVVATFGRNWSIDGVRVELSASPTMPAETAAMRWTPESPASVRIEFGVLPPGSHLLQFQLYEGDGEGARGLRAAPTVPLRVLPATLDVRVPAARSTFLPGLVEAGVLARRSQGSQGYVEGPAWRLDAAVRGYVRGSLWAGVDNPAELPILGTTSADAPLLPAVVPVPGHNRLAIELFDVLDRPVRILVGDDPPAAARGGRAVIAEFWWHDEPPQLVGEELLVEYEQPARVRLRCQLPFTAEHLGELRLGLAQSEVPARQVTKVGDDESVVAFDVPFQVWAVAAKLNDTSREQFAAQLGSTIDAHVATPAGRFPLTLRLRTTRSTLLPLTLADLRQLPAALGALRFLPVLAPNGPFPEPVPALAPPRPTFRPQVAVAVRNMSDLLLQDREFACGEARALVAALPQLPAEALARCVHREDPLGLQRLRADRLLPELVAGAPDEATLVGVDFFQAWTLSRLLGLVVADDPEAFRLPLGCELELAAYADAVRPACHGVGAHGGSVSMAHFLAAGGVQLGEHWATAGRTRDAGDVVPTRFGEGFVGLDFGVGEWVLDLPHVLGAEAVLGEWIADHVVHLQRVMAQATSPVVPASDPVGPLRHIGVVRGLALGQRRGLIDERGAPLPTARHTTLPDSVPGVMRTEQLRRDGQDLLAGRDDPRLRQVGFRLVAVPEKLTPGRGRR